MFRLYVVIYTGFDQARHCHALWATSATAAVGFVLELYPEAFTAYVATCK